MKNWLDYFEHNRSHRHTIAWESAVELDPRLRRPLIRSLQKFQVGESGEGAHLRKQAATTGDSTYEAAIDLFIKEEQEHARLMACVLRNLGAPLLQRHWSDGCFILLRRLFGLNHELLVLLMPEMIAKRYFRALRDGSRNEVLRAVFGQILHDEEGHLAFHVDFLQHAFSTLSLPGRLVLRVLWRLLFRLACLVVIFDHRAILRGVGVSSAAFWWDCGLIFDEVAAGIFSCAPTPAIARVVPGLTAHRLPASTAG
jgi:rubrerythrin